DFSTVLTTNLVTKKPNIALFTSVFDCFWKDRIPEEFPLALVEVLRIQWEKTRGKLDDPDGSVQVVAAKAASQNSDRNQESELPSFPTYSLHEALNKKDFSEMGIEESR